MVGLRTVLVSLAALGAAVAHERQQMELITSEVSGSEVCGSPRTSWVPFLHLGLVSCHRVVSIAGHAVPSERCHRTEPLT